MSSAAGVIEPDRPAPALEVSAWLNVPAGQAPAIAALRGRVIVLHAFQMLCPGCVSHGLPQAQRIHEHFDPAEVAVIGLHSVFEHHEAMTPNALRAFVHEYRWNFPIAIDRQDHGDRIPRSMRAYRMQGTPTLILIDRDGLVRSHWFGRPGDLEVGAAIAGLVAGSTRPGRSAEPPESTGGVCRDQACDLPRA